MLEISREEILKMADKMGIKYTIVESGKGGLFIEENGKERKISIEELFDIDDIVIENTQKIYKLIALHNPKTDNKYETEWWIFNPNETSYAEWIEYCGWETDIYPETLFYIEAHDPNKPHQAGEIIKYFNEHNFIYHVQCWTGDHGLGYRKEDEFLVSPNQYRNNIYDVYKGNEKEWITLGVNEIKKEHCTILDCLNSPLKK